MIKPGLKTREAWLGYLYITPELLGILLLYIFPLTFSLYLSFTEWNLVGGLKAIKFIGLDNYVRMLQDEKFYGALKNNMMFTLVTVPVGMLAALFLSVLIHYKAKMKDFFKVAFFIPYISTQVAVAAVWAALFHPSLGPINRFLVSIGMEEPPMWLGSTKFALTAIMIIAIWHGLGYKIIIYLAGLTNIPEDLYEAAGIDGASSWQKFKHITLPMLAPTNFFLSVTLIIGSFKVFDLVAFLTGGGPRESSNVIVYYLYEEGFRNFRMGYASALSWALFLIVGVISVVIAQIQKRSISQ